VVLIHESHVVANVHSDLQEISSKFRTFFRDTVYELQLIFDFLHPGAFTEVTDAVIPLDPGDECEFSPSGDKNLEYRNSTSESLSAPPPCQRCSRDNPSVSRMVWLAR
jgi:hypothetical protein